MGCVPSFFRADVSSNNPETDFFKIFKGRMSVDIFKDGLPFLRYTVLPTLQLFWHL